MSKNNQNNINQLKKSIAEYIKFIYGDTLENNLQPHEVLEPKQKIVRTQAIKSQRNKIIS